MTCGAVSQAHSEVTSRHLADLEDPLFGFGDFVLSNTKYLEKTGCNYITYHRHTLALNIGAGPGQGVSHCVLINSRTLGVVSEHRVLDFVKHSMRLSSYQ